MSGLGRIGPWQGLGILLIAGGIGGLAVAPSIQSLRQDHRTLQDQRRYMGALAEATVEAAAETCRAIEETRLRGECLAGVAATMGADGERICQEMHPGTWREECFFLVSQETAEVGAETVRLCQQAGRFESQCRGHAVGRAAQQLTIPLGGELTALREIVRLAETFYESNTDEQNRRLAIHLLAGLLAKRWEGPPDVAGCGEAPPHVCLQAARNALQAQGSAGTFCQDPDPWAQQVCRVPGPAAPDGLSVP